MKQIDDGVVDLIVTDPPYLMNYKTGYIKNPDHKFHHAIKNDDFETNRKLISDYIKESYRILKDDSAMYMFCNSIHVDFFKNELEQYFDIKNLIVWVKNNWSAGDLKHSFGRQYEFIFLVNKGKKEFNGKRITDIWYFDRVVGKQQVHQNQKPLKLLEECIIKHSNEDDLIFDGFMGSGTTGVACSNTNRKFIGVELDKIEFDIAKSRIDQAKLTNKMFDF